MQQSHQPVPPNTYYVVPLISPDGSDKYLPCAYYDASWAPVSADALHYHRHSPFVCIIQPSFAQVLERLKYPPGVDRDATFYAAVAQTRIGENSMPRVFEADNCRVLIPVFFAHSRAVILIFTKQTAHGAKLLATGDPEIKPGPDDMCPP